MPLTLEEFESRAAHAQTSEVAPAPDTETEAVRMASYEQGYQAGWDDASRAAIEDQTRIGAELARNLQDLSFSFHEARAQVVQSVEPLLRELLDTLLPRLVNDTMGARIAEELAPLIAECADTRVEIVVHPASRAALEEQLATNGFPDVALCEEPSLAEGQVYLRAGRAEREINPAAVFERIADAVASIREMNERSLKHG